MNSKQQSRFNMYLTSEKYLANNAALTAFFPRYPEFHSALKDGIVQIRTYNEQQILDKSGIATGKGQLRSALIILTIDASRKTQAYAKMENNQLLLSETKLTESALKGSTDSELEALAQGVYDKVQMHLMDLGAYNLNAGTLTTLAKAIDDFRVAIPKPRIGTIDTRQCTQQMAKAFAATDEILANIDILMEMVRISQPDFYGGYRSARRIINSRSGSLLVKGFVTDAETGAGIKGVIVRFAPDGNGSTKAKADAGTPVVEKKTAVKGGFKIKTLPEGTYSVAMRKAGYMDHMATVAVTSGELAVLNVELTKN
jgi:hypothetical protein